MREYIIKVNKNKIESPSIRLVQNDYNSTKLIFDFDFQEDYKKVFHMKLPSGTTWVKEIINNELILADQNNTEIIPVLVEDGLYEFDIAIYDDNSKLTTTDKSYFNVRSEIKGENVELDDRTPILDDLINETRQAVNEADTLDIDMQNSVITITRKDGTIKSENVKGDSYEITEEDYNTIETNVKSDIQPILENIENVAKKAEVIARGKSASVVTDTWAEMELWLKDIANKGTHKAGDNLYIKAKYTDETMTERQPDYWIAEVLEEPNEKGYYYEISELEADKPDLDAYAKTEQFVTLTQEEYDALEEKSANTYYFIIEEE